MMEKMQVDLKCSEERKSVCSGARCLLAIFAFWMVGGTAVVIWLFTDMHNEIESIRHHQKIDMRKNMNDTNNSMRLFTQMRDVKKQIDEIRETKAPNGSAVNVRHDLKGRFEEMSEHLNTVLSRVGNLSAVLSRMNVTSESTVSRLRSDLNNARDDLILLQHDLTRLNYSVHGDMKHFSDSIVSIVNELQQELRALRNSSATTTNDLWTYLNQTDEEIEEVLKLMTQQNVSLHAKVRYHSDALYAEVKDVEKKQLKFQNFTIENIRQLRSELNETRDTLQRNFDNKIKRVNSSVFAAIGKLASSMRSSVKRMKEKIESIKNDFQTKTNNIHKTQMEIKEDFSKTKLKFQEKDRKHDSDISGQVSKMKSMEKRVDDLEGKLDSEKQKTADMKKDFQRRLDSKTRQITNLKNDVADLQQTVKMKNKATGILMSNVSPIILCLIAVVTHFIS